MNKEKVFIVRFGELYLKGKNRYQFENALVNNIRRALKDTNAVVQKITGRIIVSNIEENELEIKEKIGQVFGISSYSIATKFETSEQNIIDFCKTIKLSNTTFKVEVKRADKRFLIHSNDLEKMLGSIILENNSTVKVDVHNPLVKVDVDIRETGSTYVSFEKINALGGMPVGTAGSGLLMLSGGIDSPVAGFLMGKRGLNINAVYFHSHPYTSEQARQKVRDLAKIISKYTGKFILYEVPFTKIQEEIKVNCDDRYTITIMRRLMYKITEQIAIKHKYDCLITGENLAQVASQTVQGITISNSVLTKLPMFRPLISFDKLETIAISKKIGAYETSILPYEDCCTIFVPKNPIIKPSLDVAISEEAKIPALNDLIQMAIDNTDVVTFE